MVVVGSVALLSFIMVAASFLWAVEAPSNWVAIAAASFVIALCSFFFNLSGAQYLATGKKLEKNTKKIKEAPGKVAIAVPVYKPDAEVLRESIRSFKDLEYPGEKEIYILDDTEEGEHAEKVDEVVAGEQVQLIRRGTREGGKGGALNGLLEQTDADFMAIFDADEVVKDKGFLVETMGHFEKKEVAFVQSNKECRGDGLFEQAANYTNAAFVNLIQPINTKKGVGLFTGSCGVFRVEALRSVGGFPDSKIEDVAVSLRLFWKGWKAEHVAKVYAVGSAVKKFNRFSEQHMRYISGITSLLPEYARNIWNYPAEQKAVMMVHALGLYYVSLVQLGACLIALVCAWWGIWLGEVASIAYLVSTFAALMVLSKAYVGSLRVGLYAYILNFSVVIPRMLATIGTVLGIKEFGERTLLFSGVLQFALGLLFLWVAWEGSSIACAWWGVLFLSNPVLLILKR